MDRNVRAQLQTTLFPLYHFHVHISLPSVAISISCPTLKSDPQPANAHHHTSTLSFIMNNSTHTNMCTRSQYAQIHYLSHSEIPQTHTHKKKSPTPKYWEFSKSPKNQGNMKVKQKDSTPQNNGYELVVNYWEGTVV